MPRVRSDSGRGPFVRRSEQRPAQSAVIKRSAPTHDRFAVLWIKNTTGDDLSTFDVVKLGDPICDPTVDADHERAFTSQIAVKAEQVDEDSISNVAILTAPVTDTNGQTAIATGVSVVRLTGPIGKSRADTRAGKYTLEASDLGPFEILADPGPANEERYAYVRFGGGESGGATGIVDDCECDPTTLIEGTELFGTPAPTICCRSHNLFTVYLGEVIGTRNLWYLGGDTWSTYNSDSAKDNPWVNDCGSGLEDEYDIVMDIAAGTIKLEQRSYSLVCDPVCFEYQRDAQFSCLKSNKFNLNLFAGITRPAEVGFGLDDSIDLPPCVCVVPKPALSEGPVVPSQCSPCFPNGEDAPVYAIIDVGGLALNVVGGCCNNATASANCAKMNGRYVLPLYSGSATECVWRLDEPDPLIDLGGNDFKGCGWSVRLQPSLSRILVSGGCQDAGACDASFQAYTTIPACEDIVEGFSVLITDASSTKFSDIVACFDPNNSDCGSDFSVRVTFTNVPPRPDASGHCTGCAA